jgi:hypothetical protein
LGANPLAQIFSALFRATPGTDALWSAATGGTTIGATTTTTTTTVGVLLPYTANPDEADSDFDADSDGVFLSLSSSVASLFGCITTADAAAAAGNGDGIKANETHLVLVVAEGQNEPSLWRTSFLAGDGGTFEFELVQGGAGADRGRSGSSAVAPLLQQTLSHIAVLAACDDLVIGQPASDGGASSGIGASAGVVCARISARDSLVVS